MRITRDHVIATLFHGILAAPLIYLLGAEKQRNIQKGLATLAKLHPSYEPEVHAFIASDPPRQLPVSSTADWFCGPSSGTWNEQTRVRIEPALWRADTLRVVKERPSRMRSTE